nr:DUF3102 domain-containing protein [Staphylococcus kloosii]
MAGQSIFENGRRLKHVKESDLVYGEWEKWLKKMNFNRTQAYKFIKIYEDRGSNVLSTKQNSIDALYYIATLPESERTKEHTTSSGETKTTDEMTRRGLRELKSIHDKLKGR